MSAPLPHPNLGYVIVTLPHTSDFQPVGSHFSLSYLAEDLRFDQANKLTICLWLGPAPVLADTPPNCSVFNLALEESHNTNWSCVGTLQRQKSAHIFLTSSISLSARHPSNVIVFEFSKIEELNLTPNNVVFHELLHINEKPCIALIKLDVDPSAINEEAKRLSFADLTFEMVFDLVKYLEGRKQAGDALQSSALQEWFTTVIQKVESEDPTKFLLDPTVLIAGIVAHLGKTILVEHKFDINRQEVILIPFVFVECWGTNLLIMLEGEEKNSTVKAILKSL